VASTVARAQPSRQTTPRAATAAPLIAAHQQTGWSPAPACPLALSNAAHARGADIFPATMALSGSPCSEPAMQRLGSGASGGLAGAGSGAGSPTALAAAAAAAAAGGSPPSVSAVDQFLAAAAAAAAANQAAAAAAQLGSGSSGTFSSQADTDGCCPTLLGGPGSGLASSASCSTAGSGTEEAPRKLAVLGLPWETM
jgi:hypothetical protein